MVVELQMKDTKKGKINTEKCPVYDCLVYMVYCKLIPVDEQPAWSNMTNDINKQNAKNRDSVRNSLNLLLEYKGLGVACCWSRIR